ncbi:MAG: UDP-N-acetylmuramoyl-L-alanyl-D-glutamate--2,6-diaminopimelate ligase [Bacteroidota bacterium]
MENPARKLSDLLVGIEAKQVIGDKDKRIRKITFDSRKTEENDVFIALPGAVFDGHTFIESAVEKGAVVIICSHLPNDLLKEVTYIEVADPHETLGKMAANYYDHPSGKMKLVGITGTNGKTSIATMLYHLFLGMGKQTGLISTVDIRVGEEVIPARLTTPDPIALNEYMAKMVEKGTEVVFMEVSSHAVDQRRIAGLEFVGGVFTNLSHDHIGYHKTFKAYINAKKRFFDDLPKGSFALVNVDDKRGRVMLQNTAATHKTYSLNRVADFKARILENTFHGLFLTMGGKEFHSRLIGKFNAYNLLAVYATAMLLGEDAINTLTIMSNLQTAEGRFDQMRDAERNITAIVDYAHTPDALDNVLNTIQAIRQPSQKIITVVGCGGDRDKAKRPKMAYVAVLLSDQTILTSDNPRSENPDKILEDMEKGIPVEHADKVLTITNRKQAIKTACKMADNGSIILVAGKGHEKYQEINGEKTQFDDKAFLKEFLKIQTN